MGKNLFSKLLPVPVKNDLRKCKYFMDNYGNYQIWSGLYPCIWQISLFYVVFLGIHLPFLAYTCYLSFGTDFALFSESTHFLFLLSIPVFVTIYRCYLTHTIEDLFWSLDRGIYDYEGSIDDKSASEIEKYKIEREHRKDMFSRGFAGAMYTAVFSLAVVRPLYEFSTGKKENVKYDDGINRWVPVACWVPYDSSSGVFYYFGWMCEYYVIFGTTLCTIGNTVLFLRVAEDIIYQLRMLTTLLNNAKSRADMIMKQDSLHFKDKKKNNFRCSLRLCLTHCIKHYKAITRIFSLLNDLYNYSLLVILLISVYMLCLSGIMFTSEEVEFAPKLQFAFFLSGEILHVFIYCWYGQKIIDLSGELSDVLYFTDWFNYSSDMKEYLLMLQIRCLQQLKLSVGGFMNASFNTFSSLLNSAYSYYNLMQASQ